MGVLVTVGRAPLAKCFPIAPATGNANPGPMTSGTGAVQQGWDNYYYLVGSAAAGLIGLLFVVMTLTAGRERSGILRGATLYMTPTVVHFASVLSISALSLAPGLPVAARGIAVGIFALAGLAVAIRACVGIARPRKSAEAPHWSDFWCYGAAPVALYLALAAVIAVSTTARPPWAPHALAGLLLALLLLGIRNAWDLVTWIAPARPEAPGDSAGGE